MRLRAQRLARLLWIRQAVALVLCAMLVAACATIERIPYTQQEQELARHFRILDAWMWADDPALASNNPFLDAPGRERPSFWRCPAAVPMAPSAPAC